MRLISLESGCWKIQNDQWGGRISHWPKQLSDILGFSPVNDTMLLEELEIALIVDKSQRWDRRSSQWRCCLHCHWILLSQLGLRCLLYEGDSFPKSLTTGSSLLKSLSICINDFWNNFPWWGYERLRWCRDIGISHFSPWPEADILLVFHAIFTPLHLGVLERKGGRQD